MADFSTSPVYISAKVQLGGHILVPPGYRLQLQYQAVGHTPKGWHHAARLVPEGPRKTTLFPTMALPSVLVCGITSLQTADS